MRIVVVVALQVWSFININSVLSQLSWDTWHVGQLPSEDIFVVPKKVGERAFLFCREVSTDSGRLGGIASTQVDLLDVGFFWWRDDAGLFSRYF